MPMTPTAQLMDGTSLAARIVATAGERAAEISRRTGTVPCLATVLVGDDPASAAYVKMKRARCRKAGINSRLVALPATATTGEVVSAVTALSQDPAVHGILLQHPAPGQVDERAGFEAIDPAKDVDGVTLHSYAAMSFGLPGFASCTPGAIMRLLAAFSSRGGSVVAVLHALDLAASYVSRLVVVQAGRIVADGVPSAALPRAAQAFGMELQAGARPLLGFRNGT